MQHLASSGTIGQGWGQILEKGFKSKSFEFFQIQIKSKSLLFQKDLNPNPNPFEKGIKILLKNMLE